MRIKYTTLLSFILIFSFGITVFAGGNKTMIKTKGGTFEIEIIKNNAPNHALVNNAMRTASVDTILHEDFSGDTVIPDQNNGGYMINLDEDGLPAANSRPQDWYYSEDSKNDSLGCVDSVNGMAWSNSWLQGFAPGNRNSLTFPVIVSKTGTMLSFGIASYQFPLYADGITIMISPDGTSSNANNDTLIQYGQYLSGDGSWFNPTTPYTFSATDVLLTYFGADGCQAGVLDPSIDSARGKALFHYPMFDLSAYVGQTVYVFFYHDSDDDNLIMLDDILITEPQGVGLEDNLPNVHLAAFPNPASQNLTVEYGGVEGQQVSFKILDQAGKSVFSSPARKADFGSNKVQVDVSSFSAGMYIIKIETEHGVKTTKVIVE